MLELADLCADSKADPPKIGVLVWAFRASRPVYQHSYRTGRLTAESVEDSADSTAELADSTTDSAIVGRLVGSEFINTFNILNPLESANGNRPPIASRIVSFL